MIKAQARSGRDVSIELMRVIAVFFVIFNHTGMDGYQLYAQCSPAQPAFWLYLAISVFCKFSVPLFFMISGALMLGREPEPLRVLWLRRILPMAAVLVLFSAVYYGVDVWKAGDVPDLLRFLQTIYQYHSAVKHHLWFLYFYIAYLIGLPFLQRMAQALEDRWFQYMILLSLVYGLLSMTDYLLGGAEFQMVPGLKPEWLLSNIVLYPCVGYYLGSRLQFLSGRAKHLCVWVNLCGILLSCGMTWYLGQTGESVTDERFIGVFSGFNALCVFVAVRSLVRRWQPAPALCRLICSAGGCVFGIYLVHVLLLESPFRDWLMDAIPRGVNSMLAAFMLCACVMAASWGIAFLLRKLPVIGRLLG